MPFTFANGLDPKIQAPVIQQKLVACLLTLPFVPEAADDSMGKVWRAMQDWGWVTWAQQTQGLIFVRRYKLKPDGANPFGKMWIGIQLNGVDYRVTCQGLDPTETARMLRQLQFVGLGLPDRLEMIGLCGYRARSIRRSAWAGRMPGTGSGASQGVGSVSTGAEITINYAQASQVGTGAEIAINYARPSPASTGAEIAIAYAQPAPPRPIGEVLCMNGGAEVPDPQIESPEERAEEQIDILYDNA